MATIKEFEMLLLSIPGVSEHTATLIVTEMRRAMPGEKLYIPAQDCSKRAAIELAVRTFPTSVVAERFGVSRRYAQIVAGVSKKRN